MSAPEPKITLDPRVSHDRVVPSLSLNMPTAISLKGTAPRALVADDDPIAVATLQRLLTRKGFEVATAKDGEEAWVLASSLDFDVIVSDLEMPRTDGMELFENIRNSKPDTPFVFVTGRPTLDSAVEAMNKGAAGYVTKPFEPGQVVEVLERATKDLIESPLSTRTSGTAATERFRLAILGLHLHYQPIVQWSTKSAYAHEALMRTRHEDVPHPGAFLELAEGLKQVKELGREVRNRAAEDIVGLSNAPDLVFVNLHPEELSDEQLFDESSPLSKIAGRVFLEITERESLRGMSDAVDRIRRLKKMGYRIAIDDIGAGYSGLNSFVDLEPDLVKIDMGLVRGINACAKRTKLVASLLELARDMAIQVVAEGVETPGELEALVGLGCDLFQGYLFSRPEPPFPSPEIPVLEGK